MRKPARPGRRWRLLIWVTGVGAILYSVWILGPYLRSVLVRDAAVTSWIHVATAPIQGSVEDTLPHLGFRSDTEGGDNVVKIVNRYYDTFRLDAAKATVAAAREVVAGLETQLEEERALNVSRRDMKEGYSTQFKSLLDDQIAQGEKKAKHIEEQVKLLTGLVDRRAEMARAGHRAQELVDEARLRQVEAQTELQKTLSDLAQARLFRQAADEGVYMVPGGGDPTWAVTERTQTRRAIAEVRQKLTAARAELARSELLLKGEDSKFKRQSEAWVRIPRGATVRSMIVGAGATVDVGTPVLTWLDCNILLIDAPVPDAMAALIKPGMHADVILEGERTTRRGKVLRTRGASDTLGRVDLAATATGRKAGIGQVLIELAAKPEEFAECPVGRAAFVHFPQLGLIDVLRSRLRL